MAKQTALSWIVRKAKSLQRSDRRKKQWNAYISLASALYKKKGTIGKTILLEKKESSKSKPKKVVRITRDKKGHFKKFTASTKITGITYQYRWLQNQTYLKRIAETNKLIEIEEGKLHKLTTFIKTLPVKSRKQYGKNIAELKKSIASLKKQISLTKSLIK